MTATVDASFFGHDSALVLTVDTIEALRRECDLVARGECRGKLNAAEIHNPLHGWAGEEVSLNYEVQNGTLENIDLIGVNVDYEFNIAFAGDGEYTVGDSGQIDTNLAPGMGDVGYHWELRDPDGRVVKQVPSLTSHNFYEDGHDELDYTFTEAGTYEVLVMAQDEWKNGDDESRTITVEPRDLSVDLEGSTRVTLEPLYGEATYDVTNVVGASGSLSYDWEVERPDGSTDSNFDGSSSETVRFESAGVHTVRVEASDDSSNYVETLDVWVPSKFELRGIDGPSEAFTDNEVSLDADGDLLDVGGTDYEWSVLASDDTWTLERGDHHSATITFHEPGDHTVQLTIEDAVTSETVETVVSVEEPASRPVFDVSNVRFVQNVSDSRVCTTDENVAVETDRGHALPDPDLVEGKQTAVVFDLDVPNADNVDWESNNFLTGTEITVTVDHGGSTTRHEFTLEQGADATVDHPTAPEPRPHALLGARSTPLDYGLDYVSGSDLPVFEVTSDDLSATVTFDHADGLEKASTDGSGISVREMPTMDVAFVPLVDGRHGFGPAFDDAAAEIYARKRRLTDPEQVTFDSDMFGPELDLAKYEARHGSVADLGPEGRDEFLADAHEEYLAKISYHQRVQDAVDFLESWFPATGIDALKLESPVIASRTEPAEAGEDGNHYVSDVEAAISAVHAETDDDVRVVLITPEKYNEFYGKSWDGVHPDGMRGVIASLDSADLVAHEIGHVLNEHVYADPCVATDDVIGSTDEEHFPLAKLSKEQDQVEQNCDTCVASDGYHRGLGDMDYCLDVEHARSSEYTVDFDQDTWDDVDGSAYPFDYYGRTDSIERAGGLQTDGFTLGQNSFEVAWARDATMAYNKDHTPAVPDARMYQRMMDGTSGGSFVDEGYEEDIFDRILDLFGRIGGDAQPGIVEDVSTYEGAPMVSDSDGDVTVEVLDGAGDVMHERVTSTVDTLGCAAGGGSTQVHEDLVNVAVEYPASTARLRIQWDDPPLDGVEQEEFSLIPAAVQLENAVSSVPHRASDDATSRGVDDLENLAAVVKPHLEGDEYAAAAAVLRDELHDAVRNALREDYGTTASEEDRTSLLACLEAVARRVDRMEADAPRTVQRGSGADVDVSDGSFAATLTGFDTGRVGDTERYEVAVANAADPVEVTWELRAPGDRVWKPIEGAGTGTEAAVTLSETGVYALRVTVDDGVDTDVSAKRVSVLERLTVDDRVPTQVDGSQRYWDFTGDGSVTNADVTEFFGEIADPTVNANPRYFDYDGNGEVGQSDVQALFDAV